MSQDLQPLAERFGIDAEADVDVIIVNYKTPRLTIEAVRSVLCDPTVRSVIVVDNASGDGSPEILSQEFGSDDHRIKIIESNENLGFGGGNNFGAKQATAKYLFLLNSDAVADSNCVRTLRAILDRKPSVGLVAPRVILAATGELQPGTHGIFPTPLALITRRTTASPDGDMEPDWISGVAFLTRRAEYEALSGFDESLFMYYEDVDLCRRYRQRGFTVARDSSAAVVHHLGQSGVGNPRHEAVYFASQDRYFKLAGFSSLTRSALAALRALYRLRLRSGT